MVGEPFITEAEQRSGHTPLVFSFSSDDPQREFLTSVGESRTSFLHASVPRYNRFKHGF